MMICDLVIGAVTGYDWDQIKFWVNSLDRSGFTGRKAILAYNMDYATIEQLVKRGYAVLAFTQDTITKAVSYPNKDFSIVVDRFIHYVMMLDNKANRQDIRYVVATDVRDVIFQTNPSDYLDISSLRAHELVVSSESIAYKDEAWGSNNLLQAFGDQMYNMHKDNIIVNCGVLAGRFDTFLGLCKTIYLVAHGTMPHVPGGGGPDQAALNILLSTPVYDHITQITTPNDPWAAQLGTTLDPRKIEAYKPYLKHPQPVFNPSTKQVETPLRGTPYAIVHQWDRVPEIKEAFERLYS